MCSFIRISQHISVLNEPMKLAFKSFVSLGMDEKQILMPKLINRLLYLIFTQRSINKLKVRLKF